MVADFSPQALLKINFGNGQKLGPGKVRLLELIRETGSISQAAKKMDMSYRRAWLLMDELNHMFGQGVIETAAGGSGGGGARVTEFGVAIITVFRVLERDTQALVEQGIKGLLQP
jgi:molybdate transport system regulatory protein